MISIFFIWLKIPPIGYVSSEYMGYRDKVNGIKGLGMI
jgi:hypothetical protein